MHKLCMFLHYTYINNNNKKLHAFATVGNFCNYIYNYALHLLIPQNLSLSLPVSHFDSSNIFVQHNMNTISTLHLLLFIFLLFFTHQKIMTHVLFLHLESHKLFVCYEEFLKRVCCPEATLCHSGIDMMLPL